MLFACSIPARLRGLFFRKGYRGQILLCPCRSIHTFGMSRCIDVAFIDRRGRVVSSYRDVVPGRVLRGCGAYAAVERFSVPRLPWYEPGQAIEGFQVGTNGKGRSRS